MRIFSRKVFRKIFGTHFKKILFSYVKQEVQQERMEIEKELQKKFLESSLSWEKNSIFFMNFTNQEFIEDDKRVGKGIGILTFLSFYFILYIYIYFFCSKCGKMF